MAMTPEKITEVCEFYRDTLTHGGTRVNERARHVLTMLHKIPQFVEDGRREKAMRWLGFVQGWLWTTGTFSIEDMADHNRPADSTFTHEKANEAVDG